MKRRLLRPWDQLTYRQQQICVLLARGWSGEETARELGLSINTVWQQVKMCYARLGDEARNRSDLTRLVYEQFIIPQMMLETSLETAVRNRQLTPQEVREMMSAAIHTYTRRGPLVEPPG